MPYRHDSVVAWRKDWSENLGKAVTVEGIGQVSKSGDCYIASEADDNLYFKLGGLNSWGHSETCPQNGQKIRATGVLQRDDHDGYYLKDAKWFEID